MKLNLVKPGVILLLFSLLSSGIFAQLVKHDRLLSFEDNKLPVFISAVNSTFSLSPNHYKDGLHSLEWNFKPVGELIVNKELGFEKKDPTGVDTYLSTFVVWIYNEKPIDKQLQFEFLKDGKKCTSFPFGLNFRGWRTAWVCYERDMEGIPEEEMNEIRVVAPDVEGRLFIDHLMTASKTDHRHQTADIQVPFVNAETESHWLVVLKHSLLKPDIALEPTVLSKQKKDIQMIEERFRSLIYSPSELTIKTMEGIREAYNRYHIIYKDGRVSGLPVFFARAAEAYERIMPDWNKGFISDNGVELKDYFDLMNKIAVAYNNATAEKDKADLKQMFLAMYDHAYDQGIAYGSCLGNFTHYGYSFRGFYTSYFLMKDVFIEAEKLNEAEKAMLWYAITNEVYLKPDVWGMDMDAFNTVTTGRIASILMMEDSPEKVQYLKSFSRWINNGCLPADGLSGAFKVDGGAFHHRNNYPAYAVGGLDGASNMIYLLNHTNFAVSELGHQTVKKVLLTMRFYCNKEYYPLAMSGRHPDGKGKLVPIHYAMMALAGTPDGKGEIDAELASAYLRLVTNSGNAEKDDPEYMPFITNQREQEMMKLLSDKGYKPESAPQGNIALGYGCVSVQRRNNWSAVVRGHSRYLWAAEHYFGCNLYGRYLGHANLQILTAEPGKDVTPMTSGWQEAGFDWGRVPGTTAIHLPVEQLKANILNVDVYSGFEEMLYSDEAFAGGISQEHKNGAFGMKLHEHDKYNGSHRARKSYHFFDGKIVCLGSDIENINKDYDTETTVFQLAVLTKSGRDYWETYKGESNVWMDHLGTGYYIPLKTENNQNFEKRFPQYSLNEETEKQTVGNWVSLTINHGKAPKEKSYEYVIIPQTNNDEMKSFAAKPTYKILQKDRNAHIVKDLNSNITSYVLFETPQSLPKGLIQKVDTCCLVMLREGKDKTVLTVCNPDLALYRGASDEILDKNGGRTERSIYSRPWIANKSGIIPVRVTLNGKWNIRENPACKILSANKKETVLEFTCQDGASFDIELLR